MSKRVALDISDELYAKLDEKYTTEDTTVNDVVREFLYSIGGLPMPLSAAEKRQLEGIARRKKEIAEKEAQLTKARHVPKNPFDSAKPLPQDIRR